MLPRVDSTSRLLILGKYFGRPFLIQQTPSSWCITIHPGIQALAKLICASPGGSMKLPGFYKSRCSITLSSGIRLAADRDILVLKKPAPSDNPMDARLPFVCATHSSTQPIFCYLG